MHAFLRIIRRILSLRQEDRCNGIKEAKKALVGAATDLQDKTLNNDQKGSEDPKIGSWQATNERDEKQN